MPIQKYDSFCRRVIIKRKLIEQKSEMFWSFISSIIRAYRDIYYLNKFLDKKIKISAKSKELLSGSEKIFKTLIKSYKEKDLENLNKIHELQKEFMKKSYLLLEKSKGKENIIIYRLTSSIRQFYQSVSPLTGLIM